MVMEIKRRDGGEEQSRECLYNQIWAKQASNFIRRVVTKTGWFGNITFVESFVAISVIYSWVWSDPEDNGISWRPGDFVAYQAFGGSDKEKTEKQGRWFFNIAFVRIICCD